MPPEHEDDMKTSDLSNAADFPLAFGPARGCQWPVLLVLAALLLLGASPSQAQDCSDYGGVLDGEAGDIAPAQLQIDQNCTIRNYPASNPLGTNFSFFTQPGQNPDRWLVVF
ncbi:MAG TPA: hypothetical protein VGC50_08900, partial [Gammaproteobacteria bacterium]